MANNPDPSNIWNPVALWTDISLRALDMTVNATQSIGESVDRFTRAGASVEASEAAVPSVAQRRVASTTSSGVALAADLQRSAFDLLTRGWVQCMSSLGDLASLGASIVSPIWARGNYPLEAMGRALLPVSWAEMPATQARSGTASRQHSGRRRDSHVEIGPMEHALASGEAKRRRSDGRSKSKPKARRSRNT